LSKRIPLLRGVRGVLYKNMERRKIYPYNPKLTQVARNLRNNSTLSEVLLWNQLKGKKMLGYDFHRQKPILNYVMDFFCHELELAIEIDGNSHDLGYKIQLDIQMQKEIEGLGISFLRFADGDVKFDISNVLRSIEGWILDFEEKKKHTPDPSQEGNPFF
jgi:very-short-patch-repair endonuclease